MSKLTIIDFETSGLRSFPSVAKHMVALERIADDMARGDHHMLTSAFAYSQVPVTPNKPAMPDIVCFETGAMFEFKTDRVDFGFQRSFRDEWNDVLWRRGMPVGAIKDWRQSYIPWSDMPGYMSADGRLWASYADARWGMTDDEWRKLYLCEFPLDDREDYSYETGQRKRRAEEYDTKRQLPRRDGDGAADDHHGGLPTGVRELHGRQPRTAGFRSRRPWDF